MKALTQQELQTFVSSFKQSLEGAQLQEVLVSDRGLALGFHREASSWLIIDLVPNTPMLLLFQKINPFKKGPKPKPVGLFLNSHARNLYVEDLFVDEQWGRVVKLLLKTANKECELEIRLIPKQCNLLVRAEGKQISWAKPMELSAPPVVENPPSPRSLGSLHEEWLDEQKSGVARPSLDPVAQWEKKKKKDLEKKTKALSEIQKTIDDNQEEIWQSAGVFLKTHAHLQNSRVSSLEIPELLKSCINEKQTISWNIENSFNKAKQIQAKKQGARERFHELGLEIESLKQSQFQDQNKNKGGPKTLTDLMEKSKVRGRKLHLDSGALAYCGKSAADNLALLRLAKAWDYWIHLKDYPGAHAIIHRERHQEIPPQEIQAVASWVARESLSSRSLMLGQKVAVVMVECRFVRPIKGDRLGRVTYHSEKTFQFNWTP